MSKDKTIVVIEDNQDLASAIKDMLSEEGYAVSAAYTGEDGIKLVQQEKPSLLLLDTILPQMNGLDVLEELKPYREQHDLNVVVLSNVDDPEELRAAREFDIKEYLIKTEWRMEDVIATVKKYA